MPAKKKVETTPDNAVSAEKETKKVVKKARKTTKKVTKKVEKVVEEKPVKKVKKATKAVKVAQYNNFALDTCFEMARAMGVPMGYHEFTQALLEESDIKKISKEIIKKYDIAKKFSFEEDGYDADLIEVILERVVSTMDITASDFNDLSGALETVENYENGVDATGDNDQYRIDFNALKRVLVYAQRKDIHTLADLEKEIGKDAKKSFVAFTELAYSVLPNWTVDDVKYYEGFVYSILAQFNDLYVEFEEKIMMDVSDLYLLKGNLEKGVRDYRYIVRETSNKEEAYYRFAKIYQEIDAEDANVIIEEAKRFVSETSPYFEKLNKISE
ncbi:MAG: hypothetical protein Q4C49_13410 [Bacillota bacterium]|nr:hypothetical protein [Bacillota bacterium]